MSISFILICQDDAGHIAHCIASIAAVARPGDELIVVDDGSTDGTSEMIDTHVSQVGFHPEVELRPFLLGARTPGGMGIPANIGLSLSNKEVVLFVRGRDWIDSVGFAKLRGRLALSPADIVIANYRLFDEGLDASGPPPDTDKWNAITPSGDVHTLRRQALCLWAAPWRTFYRRSFLQRQGLRFPEGGLSHDEIPFHWSTCLAARTLTLLDVTICHHRAFRPNMAEQSGQQAAFMVNFVTITKLLRRQDAAYHLIAIGWLVQNVAHQHRYLPPDGLYGYAREAAALLSGIPDALWSEALTQQGRAGCPAWLVADRLRRGDVSGQLASWESSRLLDRLDRLEAGLADVAELARHSHERSCGQDAARRFEAIRAGCARSHLD